jgi:hypothetical protein
MKIRCIAATILLGLFATAAAWAAPQQTQQDQSVAEAARKAREQQKEAPKAKVTWTNDNIPTTPGGVSVVGQPSAAAPASNAGNETEERPAAQSASSGNETPSGDAAQIQSELQDAKKQLDDAKQDLDILQRKYTLDAAQYYGTPNYSDDQKGQAMLNGEKTQIAAKQQAVGAAQKKVDDLEKQLQALNAQQKSAKPQS